MSDRPRMGHRGVSIVYQGKTCQTVAMKLDKLTYSVDETADMLGVSRSRMYRYMTTGDIFYIQPAGHRRIPAQAIEHFLRGEPYDPNAARGAETQADITTWPPTPSLLDSDIGYSRDQQRSA